MVSGWTWRTRLREWAVALASATCVGIGGLLLLPGEVHAQEVPTQGQAQGQGPSFDVEVYAPDDIQTYLERHLEIYRYRELTDLDASELERLVADADRNARDLLGTLGYFSPKIKITLIKRADLQAVAPTANSPKGVAGAAPQIVDITVNPGPMTRIRDVNVTFSGPLENDPNDAAQRAAIQARWPLRPGMPFTQSGWDDAKANARSLLTGRRYPAGRITSSRAEIDPDADSASLSVTLDSGLPYRLGPLQISGMERYDPQMVTRVARLTPGADFDLAELQDAQQRLVDSGYFDSVFVSLEPDAPPDAAPVLVQLRETKRQKVVFGIGVSTDNGPGLSVEHTNHWLPYIGWRSVSKIAVNRNAQSAEVELTSTPDRDNWRWLTSAQLKKESLATQDVTSQRLRAGRTQTGKKIDRNYFLQYDRASTTVSDATTTASAISANYAWTSRHFDSLPFPNSGYGLGVEVGGGTTLGADRAPFFRTRARWLGVYSLDSQRDGDLASSRSGRFALRLEGGAVMARENAVLPSTQLFLTGGDRTVRGYAFDEIGTTTASGQSVAGRYLAVGSVEYQRPITYNGKLTGFEGVVFIDAGAVADKPAALTAKVGVGGGVRINSPVGPLQVDLAYGVQSKRFRLHLSVGFTF